MTYDPTTPSPADTPCALCDDTTEPKVSGDADGITIVCCADSDTCLRRSLADIRIYLPESGPRP